MFQYKIFIYSIFWGENFVVWKTFNDKMGKKLQNLKRMSQEWWRVAAGQPKGLYVSRDKYLTESFDRSAKIFLFQMFAADASSQTKYKSNPSWFKWQVFVQTIEEELEYEKSFSHILKEVAIKICRCQASQFKFHSVSPHQTLTVMQIYNVFNWRLKT